MKIKIPGEMSDSAKNAKTAIIIPARYESTRLPGKPLQLIAGESLLSRVVEIARTAAAQIKSPTEVYVATDDDRIAQHCTSLGVAHLMTSRECRTGSDRLEAAVQQLTQPPQFVVNLQGDAPFTPPDFVTAIVESFLREPCDVVTPVSQLSWEELDRLRTDKQTTPFSGTCAVFDSSSGDAFWFSKQIIPTIRKEATLRSQSALSPVFRHIGLYGYSRSMLWTFTKLPEGRFEALEGLEQLRVLENGYRMRCVPVDYRGRPSMSGVDSPEDLARAEQLLVNYDRQEKS